MKPQKLIQTTNMLKRGDKAPQFELPDVNGNNVSLSQILAKGKKVVVVFYRGGWCPMCSKQLASLSSDFEKFKDKGATIVAISNEAPQKGLDLLKKIKLPYYLLVDAKSNVIEAYGVKVTKRELFDIPALRGDHKDYALPSVFIISEDSKILWVYIGKNFHARPKNTQILANL